MIKLDLHTHSEASPDGGLTRQDYRMMLMGGDLDCVAITDHNTVTFAQTMQAELGERIIVGEEVMTREGEIIGLYLHDAIPADLSLQEAVEQVKSQGGLVYVPHPFETVRHGLSQQALASIIEEVDIIETANGRAVFQNKSNMAKAWAQRFTKASAAASDAHGRSGWGRSYMEVQLQPTRDTLVALLHAGTPRVQWPGVIGLVYPKLNKLKKRIK